MKDISGRDIYVGDIVAVLSSLDFFKKVAYNMGSLVVGEITNIINENIIVKIGDENNSYKNNEISKIDLSNDIDSVITHLAQDIECLQLIKESEILNSMLGPLENYDEV